MSLIEILENDGDVHVDDDHEVDDDEGHEVDDGDEGEAAVPVGQLLVAGVAVGRLGHQRVQHVVPAGRGHQPGHGRILELPIGHRKISRSTVPGKVPTTMILAKQTKCPNSMSTYAHLA